MKQDPSSNEDQPKIKDVVERALQRTKYESFAHGSTRKRPPIPEKKLYYDELREVIYVVRNHAVQGTFSVDHFGTGQIGPYVEIANSCRNAMVKILGCTRNDIHCTVKYCTKARKGGGRRAQVWTFARSEEEKGRAMVLGPNQRIAICRNSSFASIVGCRDSRKNNWERRPHQCFSCNDLTSVPNYADSKKNWKTHYSAAVVFPLRYRTTEPGPPTDCIIGFLTFDSLIRGVFGEAPSRFDYVGQPDEYLADFKRTDVYHVGHAIADVITTVTFLAGRQIGEGATIQIEGDD